MDRKILWYLLLVMVFGFIGIWLLMPERAPDPVVRLPWQVSIDESGRSRVLGFTLGLTTLEQVRKALGEEGKLNLFLSPGRVELLTAEAYFDQLFLSGLRADLVAVLRVDQATLQGMYDRGLRISQLGSGAKKVKLAPEDEQALAQAPLRSLTYLPWKSLEPTVLEARFGSPPERFTEDSGLIHWLYPERGMDVAHDAKGAVVIQYVNPSEFLELRALLKGKGGATPASHDLTPSESAE